MKAYICNTGIITAIGNNTDENYKSLIAGKHGISMPSIVSTKHNLPVGEIKQSNQQLAEKYNIPLDWPRTTILSAIAAKEAWSPFAHKSNGLRIALLSANTVGGMDKSELSYNDFLDKIDNKEHMTMSELADIVDHFKLHECGSSAELTAKYLGLNCFTSTISTACSSSANTIMMAAKLIKKDKYDVIIAGGADSLSKFTINGFNALMILDKEHCKPYNENRQGLNIGEGAGYVVIANDKAIAQWNAQPICYVAGYANANDAHHQTATSPDGRGNQLAMTNALNVAGLQPSDIDYINLHGTGTINNDAAEGIAVARVFDGKVPPASSTKVFTGHTLGAAGGVEAVFSVLSILHQQVFPHLNLKQPISELTWKPADTLMNKEINHVMSNSFGFGGNCSALIFSKI
jgi:3-oxoacyl-[acyl-carrier-protein] synthase-1